MSEGNARARWIPLVVALGALALLAVWFFGRRASDVEPSTRSHGRAPHPNVGAAAVRLDDGGVALGGRIEGASPRAAGVESGQQDRLHVGRMDGSVQVHLPEPPAAPDFVVLSPEDLRERRVEQVAFIDARIEALDTEISRARGEGMRSVLERRREHLVERRTTLNGMVQSE